MHQGVRMAPRNRNRFVDEIESAHADGLTYLEALMEYADRNSIELETVASMARRVTPLFQKIEAECASLSMLKDSPTPELPL